MRLLGEDLCDLHLPNITRRVLYITGIMLRNICVSECVAGDFVSASKLLILTLSAVPCVNQPGCCAFANIIRVAGRVPTAPRNLIKIAVVRLKS